MQLIIKYKNRDIAKLQAENKALKDQIKGMQEWTG
jgi:cell division protein FtsB